MVKDNSDAVEEYMQVLDHIDAVTELYNQRLVTSREYREAMAHLRDEEVRLNILMGGGDEQDVHSD